MKKIYFEYDEMGKPIACHELDEFIKPEEVESVKKICQENKDEYLKRLEEKAKKQEEVIYQLENEIEWLKAKLKEQEQAILYLAGIEDDTDFEEYFGGAIHE